MGLFDSIGPALLGGGAGYLLAGPSGALAGAGLGASIGGAYAQNQANQGLTEDQMKFQEMMSNTAHRREVTDLRLAGLNPILSANAGASTPNGAAIPQVNTLEQAANSAKDFMANQVQKRQLDMNQQQTDSTVAKNTADAALSVELAKKAKVDAAVNSRGIPQADAINRGYKWLTDKLQEASQSTHKPNPQMDDYMKDFTRRQHLQFDQPNITPDKGRP